MKFLTKSHRFGETIANEPGFHHDWKELLGVIESISDADIISEYSANTPKRKSISMAINNLLKSRLVEKRWDSESAIFNDANYLQTRWRLDFSKNKISVEVAFNHGEAIAWNLMKPVLASELNHVEKKAQTRLGVVIMATEEMKRAGGFDGAVGTFEKAKRYLKPLQNQLSCPMVLIGLNAPEAFIVEHEGKPKRARFVNIGEE
jgi:hypothetical protein